MTARALTRAAILALSLAAGIADTRAQSPLVAPRIAPQTDTTDQRPLLDPKPLPLAGVLKSPILWQTWRQRFVTETGRVVDTGNNGVSHSEGQGYGLVLAVAAGDRVTFERIWGWTRANLEVRDDHLLAWRWEPDARPAVADMNDASDGDVLVAWALTEAAEAWGDQNYRLAARRLATDIVRRLIVRKSDFGPLLLPAAAGFAGPGRAGGPVLNPSYWVYPAFSRLGLVASDIDWAGLTRSGLALLKAGRFGPANLPVDWMALDDGQLRPADGFPARFGYDAIRIPLYLAFAGVGDRDTLAPFVGWAGQRRGALPIVDAGSGRGLESFSETGYAAIGALVACAATGAPFPAELRNLRPGDNYYPATLHLLALVAVQMRYPSCWRV